MAPAAMRMQPKRRLLPLSQKSFSFRFRRESRGAGFLIFLRQP